METEFSKGFTILQKNTVIVIMLDLLPKTKDRRNSEEMKQLIKFTELLDVDIMMPNFQFSSMAIMDFSFQQKKEVMQSLTMSQKEWVVMSAVSIVATDDNITPIDVKKVSNICEYLDISNEEFENIIKKINTSQSMNKNIVTNESELEKHMKSFDNLGFDNQRVYYWHKSILEVLEADGYVMSDFYYTNNNTNNKSLLQHIALKENTYNFLDSEGLINRGFCPITGEQINNTYSFTIFGRVVYLSVKGLDTCENIKRNEWNRDSKSSMDYNTFQNRKKQIREENVKIPISQYIISFLTIGLLILYCFKKCG